MSNQLYSPRACFSGFCRFDGKALFLLGCLEVLPVKRPKGLHKKRAEEMKDSVKNASKSARIETA